MRSLEDAVQLANSLPKADARERRGGRWRHAVAMTMYTLLCTAGLSCSSVCWAQSTTGSIVGTITDASQAVLPDATVTVTNLSTNVTSRTAANETGRYEFLSLPAGQYALIAWHAGFGSTKLQSIDLGVYQTLTLNVVLKVGESQETVTVDTAPTLVDTSNASLGTTVGEKTIVDMPLNLREVGSLALLVPGTVNTTGRTLATGAANGSGFNDFGYSGSGGGSGSNLLLIDGMISRALNNSSFALDPPPEMVKEFKIQNNVYDASFGLASGTVMNLVTQAGADRIHGSVWEYARNSSMDASGYFALERPSLSRNQFGGTIGGPLMRERLFYFSSYEGLRMDKAVTFATVVPTAAARSGDFSSYLTGQRVNLCAASGQAAPANLNYDSGQLFDPGTERLFNCPVNPANPSAGQVTVLVGTPVAGNRITSMDLVAQKVMDMFPQPNSTGVLNYVNQTPQQQQNDQFDVRVDANISGKDRIFVRYLVGNSNTVFPGSLPEFNGYQHFRGHNLVGGWTRTIGTSGINDVRIGYQTNFLTYTCQGCPRKSGTLANFDIAGLTNPLPQFDLYPNVILSNFALWGDGFPGYYPVRAPDAIEQFEDTFTKVVGRHTMAFGINWDFWQTKGVSDPLQANGAFNFNGQYSSLGGAMVGVSTVSDLADLELGYPSGGLYTKNAIITNLVGGRWISLFAQDSFRATSRLTVQYGLRWEYRRQPMDTNNKIAAFFPIDKTYQPGDAFLLTALPDGENDALCNDNYYRSDSGQCLILSSAMRRAKGLTGNKVRQVSYGPGLGYFAPRIGISWQPMSDGKLVVHSGFGIFMDLPNTNRMGSFANNNPVFTQTPNYVTAFGDVPPLTNGIPTKTQQVFVNAPLVSLSGITSQVMPSPFYKTPETYSWSLNVQYQLAPSLGGEVAYIGSRSLHLDYLYNTGNQPRPGAGDLQVRRPWPDFGSILYDDYSAFSNYHAVYGKLEKKSSHGLSALVSYTFSKALDNQGGDMDFASGIQDYNNPNADYGPADFNVSHSFVGSAIYELPFGRGRLVSVTSRAADALVGGWQVSAIVSAHAGFPFTVTTMQDYSNTGSSSPRPDRVCKGTGPGLVDRWFDTSCFLTKSLSQSLGAGSPRFGTSGRNILTGPGMQNWDIQITKKNRFGDRISTEFKAAFFNAFNHTNLSTPGAVIGSSTEGVISSQSGNPRNVQLAFKLMF